MATTDIYQITGGLKGRHAVAFLGGAVDDGVQVDAAVAARVSANDTEGTISAWINVPDVTGNYAIFGAGDADAVEYFYLDVNAGKVHAKCDVAGDVAWDLVTDNIVLTPHKWHHIVLVQNAVKPKIYVDSVEYSYAKGTLTETDVTESTLWFDDLANIDGAHIGAADSVAGGAALTLEFKGGISDVKLWSKALTDAEILSDFNGIALSDDATYLQNHWDFNGDYVDAGLGADNGTAVGDVILTDNYSEFISKFRNTLAAAPVVADKVVFSAYDGTGYAIVIKAA